MMTMRSTRPLLLASGLLVLPVVAWWALGMTLNHTPSVATGIWIEDRSAPVVPGVGEVVRACLGPEDQDVYRERGYLRWGLDCAGSEALLKPVAATAGALWSVSEAGVVVNGELLANTQPLRSDAEGRPMAWAGGGILSPGQVLLISTWPTSLDSRYFGPVPQDRILATMRPFLTWD